MLQHPYPVALFVCHHGELEEKCLLWWNLPHSAAVSAGWFSRVQEHNAVLTLGACVREHAAGFAY